ncbi:hypothetical protein [Thauera sinica]|uniref:Uncharacterized protein n=1 Tax=Thauera sinica TaxID=2665146 RepID=A0ABW1APQ9_9RHOO|nr:hypothetical protein [Thauera sp. K11]
MHALGTILGEARIGAIAGFNQFYVHPEMGQFERQRSGKAFDRRLAMRG